MVAYLLDRVLCWFQLVEQFHFFSLQALLLFAWLNYQEIGNFRSV